jgi:cytochrome c oxidase subunit 2
MRFLFTLLLLAVPILGVWTFVDAPNHGWWFPERASSYAEDIDKLFNLIMWLVGVVFVLTEVALMWFVFRYSKKRMDKGVFTHGNHTLEMIWTAIPALVLLYIAFAQMGTWASIKFKKDFPGQEGQQASRFTIDHPIADVFASQFDWRFRYPGDDKLLGTVDDIENAYEFVVPVNEPIVFNLHSRDVIHSFFVPQFRIKQDALPGHTIPVWFMATKEGIYDLVCAELCGWGHERMAAMKKAWFSNGSEDAQ